MKRIGIVTGASSGMGREFVYELLRSQKIEELWLIARREERLARLVDQFGVSVRSFPLDLTKMESFRTLEQSLFAEKPGIVYLVNAAGAGRMGKIEEISCEGHAMMADLNVRALTCMSRICLPYMTEGSHIIELCSGSAFLPQPGFATYAASKAYVLSFSRALGQELKKRKISVTAVCPGPVDTEFFQAAGSPVHPSKKRFMAKPEDVVKKALRDAESKKPVSVYGIPMKLVHLAGKILPTRVVLAVMDRVLANEEE